jgi:hypothetical protein
MSFLPKIRERNGSIELPLPLAPLFFEQRGRRGTKVGRRTLGEAFLPLVATHLALESGPRNVAQCLVTLPRITPKASMEGFGQILDLEACHDHSLAC